VKGPFESVEEMKKTFLTRKAYEIPLIISEKGEQQNDENR